MSRLLCCLRARRHDMGAALYPAQPQEGEACDGAAEHVAPPTMADVIRERKKKAGGAALGTLRRRLVAAARRPRDSRPDRGCEHARFIRSVVSSWRLAEVFVLCEQLEAGAALRDLVTQAELAREPAPALHQDLAQAYRDRWVCDVELVGAGWSVSAHRAILAARCSYFRELLQRYPGACRVPLEGVAAGLCREEVEAGVAALYAGSSCARRPPCDLCNKWDRGKESELDIISGENTASRGGCACGGRGRGGRGEARLLRRLADLLGFSLDTLHRDMKYLLDSGEQSDSRLVFRLEGGGAAYGFRAALELPCHRVVLAARSRFFRSVLSRGISGGCCGGVPGGGACGGVGGAGGGAGAVCADERVLPRRFARALLHAAYTDQVDLGLIGRNSPSPASTGSASSAPTVWSGVSRTSPRPNNTTTLDDAFQLYEIARFLEMPIVVQGCEDAIVEALSADTLPHVLRWAAAPHASQWVHRQAMRYLRDEFPAIMWQASSARLPRSAVAEALGSPFLQASEAQALRALLRWAERAAAPKHAQHDNREPNVIWHTAHSVSRRGARRRESGEQAVRDLLAALLPLVRLEHLPPDCDLLHQAVRRGAVAQPPAQMVEGGGGAEAWLGRGASRPPRCFIPYLDEIKALLEDQAVPEAEVSRVRRARFLHRIPDTLYMVAAARSGASSASGGVGGVGGAGGGVGGAEAACVSPRVLAALRARVRELRAAPPAQRALLLHATDTKQVHHQIALRAVREMSLPDTCADLLTDLDDNSDNSDKECGGSSLCVEEEWACGSEAGAWPRQAPPRLPDVPDLPDVDDCCRSGSGSLRSGNSRAAAVFLQAERESSTCRRELPPRPDTHRSVRGRLSACVPDVAMAPNANTHLLTARDYMYAGNAHAPPTHLAPPSAPAPAPGPAPLPAPAPVPAPAPAPVHHMRHTEYGGGLQLDLGDGATHTPRPGSRAQRAAAHAAAHTAHTARHRDNNQALSCVRTRNDDEELRAAIELSVIRAYSSLAGASAARNRHYADLLPPDFGGVRSRATPSPSSLSAGSVGNVGNMGSVGSMSGVGGVGVGVGMPGAALARRRIDRLTPPPRLSASQGVGVGVGAVGGALGAECGRVGGSRSGTPSPRTLPTDSLYRPRDRDRDRDRERDYR